MKQSTQPLKDKWIVVTRPEHQAGALSKRLEQAGARVILFPLIAIRPAQNIALAKKQLTQLAAYDLLVFVSPNAVDACLKWVNIASLQSCKIASVGAKTKAKLISYGLDVKISPQENYNSEALLALPEMKKLGLSDSGKPHKVAILRGEGGRNFLKESLEKQGCQVDYIELYQRKCPQNSLDALKEKAANNQLDVIIMTSGTSVKNLFALQAQAAHDWLNTTTLLAGSERIKQQVLSSTSHTGLVLSTLNPGDEKLYQKLLEWSKTT